MEVLRALGSLIEAPAPQHARIAAALGLPEVPGPAVYGKVVEFQRYPYASVYMGAEGMLGGAARDRIAGFRRALGVDRAGAGHGSAPGPDAAASGAARTGGSPAPAAADHLAALLALLAALERWRAEEPDAARAALLEEARVTLLWEHVASWAGPYLATFERCGAPFHEAWASLLADALDEVAAGMALPDYLPRALRGAPALADPREEGGAAFIAALLAPVRSGVILLRDDLERLGAQTGMVCRAGERRYVLGAFFAQDPSAALGWLARHAAGWGGRIAAGWGPPRVAGWWGGRARGTAELLADLSREAAAGTVVATSPAPGAAR